MRDRTLKLWLVAAAMASLSSCGAYAAGLGKLIVLSTLGQPLNAEVELLSVQKGETITARLASPEVYQQAGAQYNNVLTGTRVTVERRPNGEMYLKATTPRPVNEPFLELLFEINSEHGRVVRQYTALLDPPGYGRAAGEIPPPVTRAPEVTPPVTAAPPAAASPVPPRPAPIAEGPLSAPEQPAAAPAKPAPAPRAPAAAARAPGATPAAGERQYGPVKPGETLARIARNVRPEGVTLEQTLVGLYRQNPDAFIKKNMNLVKSGKILRVPDASEMVTLAQTDATQEVRMQVADFNAYRNRLADRPATAPEAGSLRSGRIGTSRVTERGAAEGPRDTVRVSRGEPAAKSKGGAAMNTAERLRALEEEVIAREKALAEANERIAQLEQIIRDTQRAMELKSATGGAVQKGTEKAGAPAPTGPVAVAPPAAKGQDIPPATKAPEPPPSAKAAPPQPAPSAPVAEAPKAPEPAVAAAPKAEPPPKAETAAKAKAAAPPEPGAQPSFMDTLLEEPLYLAAGGAVVLLGGLGLMIARRRRSAERLDDADESTKIAPTFGGEPPATEANWGDSLIERAAARADASSRTVQETKPVASPSAMPSPSVSEVPVPPASRRSPAAADDNDLDFDLMNRRHGAKPERVQPSSMPDFLKNANANASSNVHDRGARAPDAGKGDFELEPLPPIDAPMDAEKVSSEPPPNVDFKLDLADLDVNASSRVPGEAGRDDHWYDVQQKFELARAYEEMGDKSGARDILQEVLREGDEDQQAQAKKLLESLS